MYSNRSAEDKAAAVKGPRQVVDHLESLAEVKITLTKYIQFLQNLEPSFPTGFLLRTGTSKIIADGVIEKKDG